MTRDKYSKCRGKDKCKEINVKLIDMEDIKRPFNIG